MLPVMDTNRQLESVGVSRHELGVKTNCDAYVYDFTREDLIKKVRRLIDSFNGTLEQYLKHPTRDMVDLVTANDRLDEIQWTHALKSALRRRAKAGVPMTFDESRIREVLYRPFTKVWLYEDWDILAQGKKNCKILPTRICTHTHTHTQSLSDTLANSRLVPSRQTVSATSASLDAKRESSKDDSDDQRRPDVDDERSVRSDHGQESPTVQGDKPRAVEDPGGGSVVPHRDRSLQDWQRTNRRISRDCGITVACRVIPQRSSRRAPPTWQSSQPS